MGLGKSTVREELLGPDIPYINADFIAKELKSQQASLMLAEMARQYGSEQMKKYIAAGDSFAFENNLHEANTFKWLEEMQKKGYRIELYYLGVDSLLITTKRIQERVKRGEHHVPPNEVYARYENGLKLLRHYFSMPEKLLIIDNTKTRITCLEAEKGQILYKLEKAPAWVESFIQSLDLNQSLSVKTLNSVEEVRKSYERLKQQATIPKTTDPPKDQSES